VADKGEEMSSNEPDYKRPFSTKDFRGYFTWKKSLSKKLSCKLYHACHLDELKEISGDEQLGLRSKWSLDLPVHGLYSAPGTWTGLNYFNRGNHYGPFQISFPISVLNGRSFMVFRRKGSDRHRHFFVQYEAKIPIYSFKDKIWRNVKAASYFRENGGKSLSLKVGGIYDIIITEPISLKKATITGINHPRCIPGKCKGLTSAESKEIVKTLAKKRFKKYLKNTSFYENFIELFPDLEGERIRLPEVD
jgi:hypothetical protein